MIDYRREAKGRQCMIRLPGCNHNRSTTVLCHYPLAGYTGMGIKPDDLVFGAWGCSSCHDIVDGRVQTEHSREVIRLAHAEGVMRTQDALRQEGKLG